MAKTNKKAVTVRRVRNRMTLCFTILMMLVVFFGTVYMYIRLKNLSDQKCRDIVASANIRLTASINYFTSSTEAFCTSALSMDEVVSFDPVGGIYSDDELEELRGGVTDRLIKLSAGRNYNDFFILYQDSTAAGRISEGIGELIKKNGYGLFEERLKDGAECWLYSSAWSDSKIFYIRRASEHSLFVMSCYVSEMDELFGDTGYDGASYILYGDHNIVLFSNVDSLSCGRLLPSDLVSVFNDPNGDSTVNNGVIAASTATDCGWHIIISVKSPIPEIGLSMLILAAVIMGTAISVVCYLMGLIASANFVISEIKASGDEFIDQTTGRYNEYGLDEKISEKLETSLVGSTYAFVMVGVKDSEQVRNAVTNKCWTDIRTKLITVSEEYFANRKFIIGRMHTDRIVLFVDFSEFDIFKAHQTLEQECKDFCKAFDGMTAGEDNALRLYVNIGASIYPDHADDFDTLLEKAAKALNEANLKDGDSFVLYTPSKHESEEMK